MNRTRLVQLGGLAALAGGALHALQSFLWPSYRENVFFLFVVLGAMAAIVAIAALLVSEGDRWMMLLVPLIALVGVVLMLVYVLAWLAEQENSTGVVALLLVGLLVSTVGLLLLGILVIRFGVLPWWGGAALIAGSPLLALFLRVFLNLLVRIPIDVTGVVWAVVGYAIVRAAGRRAEEPRPRVR